jgi:RNA polymerase sigma-70 factor (ECF subfamily)
VTDDSADAPDVHSVEPEGVDMGDSTDWTDTAREFALFYEQAKGPVFRAMLLMTKNRVHAEDATATAFMQAWKHWEEEVAGHPNPKAWVVRVARNAHISSWRRWEGRWRSDVPDAPTLDVRGSIDPQLVRELCALPYRQRQVVALRDLAGLTTDETADHLEISPKTVTVHLYRAHRALRQALGEAWKTEGRDG